MDKVFAIYSRKSRYTGKGESVENQIEICRDYLKMHFGRESAASAVIFEDEGFSGKSLDRPQFQEMMKAVKDKKITAIVCYRLDRISRNIGDFSALITELNNIGVGFVSVREQFDTNSPMGRAMMYISSVFSQLERETIAERIRDNLHELAKTGRWLGGTTPTGYISVSETSVNINGKSKKAFHLKVKEEEAALVKLIFSHYSKCGSLTKTESFLLSHHYKTKNGRDFTRFAVKGILQNPVYMIADDDALNYLRMKEAALFSDDSEFDSYHGIMAYNRTEQEQGKANKRNGITEWIVCVGKHEGLISGADWVSVQEMLERSKSKSYRKERSHTALLSGILKCGKCGEYMRPHLTTRVNKDGEHTYYYACNLKLRSKKSRCDGKNANGNELDKLVVEAVKNLDLNGRDYFSSLKKTLSASNIEKNRMESEAGKLRTEIEQAERNIAKLVDTLANADGAEQYLTDRIHQLGQQVADNKVRLKEIKYNSKEPFDRLDAAEAMKSLDGRFADHLDHMTLEQRRRAVRAFVKEVIWDGECAHIIFFGSAESTAPMYPLSEHRK